MHTEGAMDCIIPEDVLQAAHLTPEELKREVAVYLFREERLTLGQASQLAAMSPHAFQHLLASQGIDPHYDVEELEEDEATLRKMGRL